MEPPKTHQSILHRTLLPPPSGRLSYSFQAPLNLMAQAERVDELKQAFHACQGADSGTIVTLDLIPNLKQIAEWDLVDRLRRSNLKTVSFRDIVGLADLEEFLDSPKDEDMAVSDTTSELESSQGRLRMASLEDSASLKAANEGKVKEEEEEKSVAAPDPVKPWKNGRTESQELLNRELEERLKENERRRDEMPVAVAVLVDRIEQKTREVPRESIESSVTEESEEEAPSAPPMEEPARAAPGSQKKKKKKKQKRSQETPAKSPWRSWISSPFSKRQLEEEDWEDAKIPEVGRTPPSRKADKAAASRAAAASEKTSHSRSSSRDDRRRAQSSAEAKESVERKPPKTPAKMQEAFEMRRSVSSGGREIPLGPPIQEPLPAEKPVPNFEENTEKLADESDDLHAATRNRAGNKYSERNKKHFRNASEMPRSSYADLTKPEDRLGEKFQFHSRHISELPDREPMVSVDDNFVARSHIQRAEEKIDPIPGHLRLFGLVGDRLEAMMAIQYRTNQIGEQDIGLLRAHAPRNTGGGLQIMWEGMLEKKGTTTLMGGFHHRYVILYGAANGDQDEMELRWYKRKVESAWGGIPIEERGSIPLSRVSDVEPILRGNTQRTFVVSLRPEELPVDHDDDEAENVEDENLRGDLDLRELTSPHTVRTHSQKGLTASTFTFRAETGLQAKLWTIVLKGFVEEVRGRHH